ncbi:hypothetical protein ACTFIW_010447 [Dictyostelium discoideum]
MRKIKILKKTCTSNVERYQRIRYRLLGHLLIVGSTKEECLSNLKKTMDLLVKLGFKLNLEKSVLEPTQSFTFLGLQTDSVSMKLLVPKEKKKSVIKEIRNFLNLDCCSPRKLVGLKGKLIALKDDFPSVRLAFPLNQQVFTLVEQTSSTLSVSLANGDWDQSFPIPQDVNSEISCFYNTDLPNLEISNLVSDDSSSSSSSSSSHVSSSTGNIPRSIDQTISRVNTNLISSYTRFHNFCILNSLNPANITLDVFMDYLTHLFIHKPPLAFSTINGHRSMLNQLLPLKNQTDIVNYPFITRIMTGIHKLRPSSAKYQEIWDANQVFKYLFTIKVIPKYTYTPLLNKTLVLCKMFGLSDLVKWSFNGLIITPDSIKGPVINAKEQRKDVLSILELTSLDDTNSQVCPVRHLSTYIRASKGRRKPHSGDSVFFQNEGKPLDVKEINNII